MPSFIDDIFDVVGLGRDDTQQRSIIKKTTKPIAPAFKNINRAGKILDEDIIGISPFISALKRGEPKGIAMGAVGFAPGGKLLKPITKVVAPAFKAGKKTKGIENVSRTFVHPHLQSKITDLKQSDTYRMLPSSERRKRVRALEKENTLYIPRANARIGRVIEEIQDEIRPFLSKTPLARSAEQKFRIERQVDRIIKARINDYRQGVIPRFVEEELGDFWSKAGKRVFDTPNDLARIMYLYLNPAYVPINLAGNLVFNLIHGALNPRNLVRLIQVQREFTGAERRLIDGGSGTGIAIGVGGNVGGVSPLKPVVNTLASLTSKVVDLMPRRLAFLHEAAKHGYKTPSDVKRLLNTPSLQNRLELVFKGARESMGDYERLSSFEKQYVSRAIFFYPWIKVATRHTARMPLEHPAQSVALGILGYEAHERDIGDRASYLAFLQSIPGTDMFSDPRQLFPATTPIEIAMAAKDFLMQTGAGPKDLAEKFTPTILNAGKMLWGGENPLDVLKEEFIEPFAPKRIYGVLTETKEEFKTRQEESVRPRGKTLDLLSHFLSRSATPSGFNPKAAKRQKKFLERPKGPSLTEQKNEELKDTKYILKKHGFTDLPAGYEEGFENYYRVKDLAGGLRDFFYTSEFSPVQNNPRDAANNRRRSAVLAAVYAETHPEHEDYVKDIMDYAKGKPEVTSALIVQLEQMLNISLYFDLRNTIKDLN